VLLCHGTIMRVLWRLLMVAPCAVTCV
jgi:hypothetical protein